MMLSRYWTCSKFATWIRGVPKPKGATMEGWEQWKIESRAKHPIRFWLAEDGLSKLETWLFAPLSKMDDIRAYIVNRFVTKTHCLIANKDDIKPGTYAEFSDQMLPCLFQGLVDYVEVSLAWDNVVWSEDSRKVYGVSWKNTRLPFILFNQWRSAKAGREHLEWECSLILDESCGVDKDSESYGKPTRQAMAAKEILALYDWWKTRKFRQDPLDESGWMEYCDNKRNDKSLNEGVDKYAILDRLNELEAQYEAEDTEMMIRLIKVRKSLWT